MMNRFFMGIFALLSGCAQRQEPTSPPPGPVSYIVGAPYQVGGEWQYPHEFSSYDVTGLGVVMSRPDSGYSTDNEAYDPNGLMAASPVLPLPSIVTVTNLVNGYSTQVRVNQRGPDQPGRVIAVTPHVAQLLGFPPGGIVEVEVTLDANASAALQSNLGAGPRLQAAPVAGITAQSLAPPGSSVGEGAARQLMPENQGETKIQGPNLTGQVRITTPAPGPLWVRVSGFGSMDDANITLEKLGNMPARVLPVFGGTRTLWAVETGPYHDVEAADAALQQELALGIAGPEIVVR